MKHLPHRVSPVRTRIVACCLVAALPLAGCAEEQTQAADDIEITTPTAEPAPDFEQKKVEPLVTKEITGKRVEDPAMKLSYKWQGTSYGVNGGTVVVVAVTNESKVPMPADTLKPVLRYSTNGSSYTDAAPLGKEQSGVDILGIDLPLGPGATVNAKYPFDVATGNLWDAEFTVGNVTFKGNLNN